MNNNEMFGHGAMLLSAGCVIYILGVLIMTVLR